MYNIIIILIGHYIADFILQSKETALNKSTSKKVLFKHSLVYSIFMTITILIVVLNNMLIIKESFTLVILSVPLFFIITLILHFVIDYITSKVTKKLFSKNILYTDVPNFGAFSIIGLDQLIHYILLFLTYYILI